LCGLQKIEKIQFCRPEDLVDKIKVKCSNEIFWVQKRKQK
jgi:hypothetical protein